MYLPLSNNTVRVRLVDTTTVMTVKAECLVSPVQPGHEILSLTDVAFLVEHEPSGQKVMFDLGCRKDYWNLPESVRQILGGAIPGLRVEKDVSEILVESGVDLTSINSVIWSHYHWDHTGNCAVFPPSTSIVVGPGFKMAPFLLPGYPEVPNSPISSSHLAGRSLVEIDFNQTPLQIGGFAAYDFFEDGSFYLLDCPGHCVGHMCALARTTADATDQNANTFIFMGADICHFPGVFRPNQSNPFPDSIELYAGCPCSIFTRDYYPSASKLSLDTAHITPWYQVSDHSESGYADVMAARQSVSRMQQFDGDERVMVCIAHDRILLDVLPTLNASPNADLNSWYAYGWKGACYWGWVRELPQNGSSGRAPIVDGLWRNGSKVT